jgi:TolA-binding protein
VSAADHSAAHARLLHAHVLTSTESLEALQDQVRDVVRASVPGWERQRLLERNVHVLARDVQSLQQTILSQNQNIQRLVERERARMAREAEQGIMPPQNLQPEGQPPVHAAVAGGAAGPGDAAAVMPRRRGPLSQLLYAGLVSGVQAGVLVLLAMGITRILQHGARSGAGTRGGAASASVSDGLFGGLFGASGGAGSARGDGGAAAIQSVVGAPLHSAAARFTDWMTRFRVDIQSRV